MATPTNRSLARSRILPRVIAKRNRLATIRRKLGERNPRFGSDS
jgi:hypothetical protein